MKKLILEFINTNWMINRQENFDEGRSLGGIETLFFNEWDMC